jgi:hypothetical protein
MPATAPHTQGAPRAAGAGRGAPEALAAPAHLVEAVAEHAEALVAQLLHQPLQQLQLLVDGAADVQRRDDACGVLRRGMGVGAEGERGGRRARLGLPASAGLRRDRSSGRARPPARVRARRTCRLKSESTSDATTAVGCGRLMRTAACSSAARPRDAPHEARLAAARAAGRERLKRLRRLGAFATEAAAPPPPPPAPGPAADL